MPEQKIGHTEQQIILLYLITVLVQFYAQTSLTAQNKKRIIPVSDESFMENYNYYCTLYHQHKNMEDYLFFTVNRDGRGMMSEDNVQRILKKYADMARKTDPAFPKHPNRQK